jgi:hypothetical protein
VIQTQRTFRAFVYKQPKRTHNKHTMSIGHSFEQRRSDVQVTRQNEDDFWTIGRRRGYAGYHLGFVTQDGNSILWKASDNAYGQWVPRPLVSDVMTPIIHGDSRASTHAARAALNAPNGEFAPTLGMVWKWIGPRGGAMRKHGGWYSQMYPLSGQQIGFDDPTPGTALVIMVPK